MSSWESAVDMVEARMPARAIPAMMARKGPYWLIRLGSWMTMVSDSELDVAANANELPGYLNLTQGYDAATGQAGSYGALSIVSTLAWVLGYFRKPPRTV